MKGTINALTSHRYEPDRDDEHLQSLAGASQTIDSECQQSSNVGSEPRRADPSPPLRAGDED